MKFSKLNAAVELLACNLGRHPHKTAYFCEDREFSYSELAKACHSFAYFLQEQGIGPQERVLIALPDCFAFPVAFLGCLLAGVIAVAVSPTLGKEDLAYIIEDCGARLFLVLGELAATLPETCNKCKVIVSNDQGPVGEAIVFDGLVNPYQPLADDFAYMLYSSGSTGKPKGVPHRHKSLLLPGDLVGEPLLGITSDDVIFSSSKLSFSYGLINSLAFTLRFGASTVLYPGNSDPRAILGIIRRHNPSIFFSVPTIYTQIILSCKERELRFPMRLCCSAGEALPVAVFEEWQRLTGLEIIDGIGSTETAYHFISNVPGKAVAGSVGRLVPGYQVRLVDDNGRDVPAGNEGNLLVSGETISLYYWDLPEKSAETMLSGGVIRTGDVLMERDGFYYYQGREDDMIKSGACWVSTFIMEDILRSHAGVADCAVAAVSDGIFNKPGAFIVLKPGIEQTTGLISELRAYMMARLPKNMCPICFRFMEELPRTSNGKVQRFRLRE
jgi:benzoate-CoA ligase